MRPIPILTGPTGVGKTNLSLELAELVGGEIINADSRQVYRGMTVGTAKPSTEELQRVRHHLIDILEIDEIISAGKFLRLASAAIDDILGRGRLPIIVGGSTLYVSSLTHGLAQTPDVPASVRTKVEEDGISHGFDQLFQELQTVDPVSAASMDSSKTQRIVRALEVFRATGKPLSSFYASPYSLPYSFSPFILFRPRDELYERINRRVEAMLDDGLIEEVTKLRQGGVNDHLYSLRSPGYSEAISFLKGQIPKGEMTRLIARNTRRYAKRQLTWFKRYPDHHWVSVDDYSAKSLLAAINDNVFPRTIP